VRVGITGSTHGSKGEKRNYKIVIKMDLIVFPTTTTSAIIIIISSSRKQKQQ